MAGIDMPPELPTVITAADGITRCRWATGTGRDLTVYHDVEWGRPTHDEVALFEALALTYFENGLSWVTVFDKRDNFRRAFRGFQPHAVASMTARDVDRLMTDSTIVRNRRKIEATVHNARVMATCSLAQLVWVHQPRCHHRLRSWTDGRMDSPESKAMPVALRAAGFRLIGPAVAHSFMQIVGIENGHFEGCFRA